MRSEPNYNTIPVGQLGIIALPGCEELANKIDNYLIRWRFQRNSEHKDTLAFAGYEKSTYLINMDFPVSVQAKVKQRLTRRSEAMIFTFFAMFSTTA